MFSLDPSDIALAVDLVLALAFTFYFSLGRPRAWYRDRLGWVIFSYALAVDALLGLIVYALLTGERVDEPFRFAVGAALGLALLAKTWSVHQERREGRLAGAQAYSAERKTMSTETPALTIAEISSATEIWYKAQRVLRTIVATLVSALSIWALIATVAPQILDELAKILPGSWVAWLAGVVAAISAVAGVISRIMAIPKVNAFLTKWLGLGSVPKSALAVEPVAVIGDVPDDWSAAAEQGVIVEPDSKVG